MFVTQILIRNRFRTFPQNLKNAVPNRFQRIYWHYVPNRTELWKSILQTPNIASMIATVYGKFAYQANDINSFKFE